MPEYLPLSPMGIGTLEVESLRSYLCRLAALHGVTLASFMLHVGSKCKRRKDGIALQRFMHQTTIACGIGSNVAMLIKTLTPLTGQQDLGRLTLLELDKVLSGGQGLVKPIRTWCPVCYDEHRRNDESYYDRLLWSMPPVTRCPLHQVDLVSECAQCGKPQRLYHQSGRLELCHECNRTIVTESLSIHINRKPQFGESDCCAIVASISSGKLSVRRGAVQIFRAELERLLGSNQREKDACELLDNKIGALVAKRKKPFQFPTLLRLAITLDLRLMDLLTSPRDAAHAAGGLLRDHIRGDTVNFTRQTKEQRTRIRKRISRELAKPEGKPLLAKAALCQELGVTMNALRYAGADLLDGYETRRIQAVTEAKHTVDMAMRSLLERYYLDAYLKGHLPSQKVVACVLSDRCGASIRHARSVVSEVIHAHERALR